MAKGLIQLLKEIGFEKVYRVRGLLITKPNERALSHILSDIRSLTGVTIARVEELPNQDMQALSYKNIIILKVDPYPYIKSDSFSHAQSKEIINHLREEISKIEGIKSIRFSEKIEIKDN